MEEDTGLFGVIFPLMSDKLWRQWQSWYSWLLMLIGLTDVGVLVVLDVRGEAQIRLCKKRTDLREISGLLSNEQYAFLVPNTAGTIELIEDQPWRQSKFEHVVDAWNVRVDADAITFLLGDGSGQRWTWGAVGKFTELIYKYWAFGGTHMFARPMREMFVSGGTVLLGVFADAQAQMELLTEAIASQQQVTNDGHTTMRVRAQLRAIEELQRIVQELQTSPESGSLEVLRLQLILLRRMDIVAHENAAVAPSQLDAVQLECKQHIAECERLIAKREQALSAERARRTRKKGA